uniref:C2H2-type domain-containing protein n=1 Tax=Noccaea caerulescens TaxID=107243 RepID=A0A1J3GYR6_NOCCA
MAARKLGSFLRQHFLALLFLLLGCFFFPRGSDCRQKRRKKKLRTVSSSSPSGSGLSSSWTYLKRVFLSTTRISKSRNQTHPNGPLTTLTSARSSQNSLVTLVQPDTTNQPDPEPRIENGFSEISDSLFLPLCSEIYSCTACGEIFSKINLLEQHIAIKHAVSELIDGESSTNIVKIIFKSGWPEHGNKIPEIQRILKIHNSPKILTRFEEYREFVKAKAARSNGGGRQWDDERCVADGNELLRFYCSTFMCNLGQNGSSSLCGHQYCSICGIIGSGFSPKLDGIATLATGWRGHVAVPEEVEKEFGFMNVKRAMLVCRVVAGRVGCDLIADDDVDKNDGGYDSLVGQGTGNKSGALLRIDDDELLVFNPRAVLPCFMIVYTV